MTPSIKIINKTQGDSQGDLLPAAVSGIDHLKGQARTFKYLLNDMETLAKLKKAVYRTAPATPGLLKSKLSLHQW
jgi:hypothetical protein